MHSIDFLTVLLAAAAVPTVLLAWKSPRTLGRVIVWFARNTVGFLARFYWAALVGTARRQAGLPTSPRPRARQLV